MRHLGLKAEHVAVEVNKDLVTRSRHAETLIAEGDVLEVVTLVGGGAGAAPTVRAAHDRHACRSAAGCSSGRASTRRSS